MKKFLLASFIFLSTILNVKASHIIRFEIENKYEYSGVVEYEIINKKTKESILFLAEGIKECILPDDWVEVSIQELTCDEFYEPNYGIYFYDFYKNDEIIIKKVLEKNQVSLLWHHSLTSLSKNKTYFDPSKRLDIYDEYGNFIMTATSNNIFLPSGYYIFKAPYYYGENKVIPLKRGGAFYDSPGKMIDGLWPDHEIKDVCNPQGECFSYTKVNETIIFDEPLFPGTYLINDQEFVLLPKDVIEKYNAYILKIENVPCDEEEQIPEPIIDSKEENIPELNEEKEYESNNFADSTDTLVIEVPDTGLIPQEEVIYYVKKDNY